MRTAALRVPDVGEIWRHFERDWADGINHRWSFWLVEDRAQMVRVYADIEISSLSDLDDALESLGTTAYDINCIDSDGEYNDVKGTVHGYNGWQYYASSLERFVLGYLEILKTKVQNALQEREDEVLERLASLPGRIKDLPVRDYPSWLKPPPSWLAATGWDEGDCSPVPEDRPFLLDNNTPTEEDELRDMTAPEDIMYEREQGHIDEEIPF